MMTSFDELERWLKKPEDINLEFKEANNDFGRDRDLPDYCAALANEKGGKLILGVSNNGVIVGSMAFMGTHNKLSHELLNKIHVRVDVEEVIHPQGRVLIFHVPSRSVGMIISSTGKYRYPMRAGESLTEMDTQTIKRMLNEGEPDYSAQIVSGFSLEDIDENAVTNFRSLWAEKAGRAEYISYSSDKTLRSLGLLQNEGLNYAALILFGKKEKIDRLLPCSEIIYEWRVSPKKTTHDFRKTWREPFFRIYEDVWGTINARNARNPFQDGLFQREISAFSEKPIREALLNAVAHRDYSISSQSIFIRTSSEAFEIVSPGGFPDGITIENILHRSAWRNRCIAEVFEKAGLAERSGQGMDDIFGDTVREGKGLPDLSKSDAHSVTLCIPAQVRDPNFILFLSRVAREKQIDFSFDEMCELEQIREGKQIQRTEHIQKFLNIGIVEKVGRTRGIKYILSHYYYAAAGKPGVHTRRLGLAQEKYKELIIAHIKRNGKGFRRDIFDALPEHNRMGVSNLLRQLRKDGRIRFVGPKRTGYWVAN